MHWGLGFLISSQECIVNYLVQERGAKPPVCAEFERERKKMSVGGAEEHGSTGARVLQKTT